MLEQHAKTKYGCLSSSDELSGIGDTSLAVTTESSSAKENLTSELKDAKSEEDADYSDDGIENSKRKSVLEMANAIESSIPLSNQAVRTPATILVDDTESVSTPVREPKSRFWSLQGRRSSIASTLSKSKRPRPAPIYKSPVQEPKEAANEASLDSKCLNVSPVTSPARIRLMSVPKPLSPMPTKSSNRTVTTRETLQGSGPKVRLTRAALLKLKAQGKQQLQQQQRNLPKRDETALKTRTNGFVNKRQPARTPRQADYPKPWLVSDSRKTTSSTRATRSPRPLAEPCSTGKEPQINHLPGRRSRSRPAPMTKQTGKVRLTRSAILQLRQSQEKAAAQMTLQDMDNQRLGIPPVKFLEIPKSPTKINFEDDEMEHPNDIARRKLRQLFDDNSKPKAR
ncbi:MAG: hypothetical protein SGBAC_005815 [Bacillariaceae sp.]